MMSEKDSAEDRDYESGPFCKHFHDPSECQELCNTCKHQCNRHSYHDGSCDKCDCEDFVEGDTEEKQCKCGGKVTLSLKDGWIYHATPICDEHKIASINLGWDDVSEYDE